MVTVEYRLTCSRTTGSLKLEFFVLADVAPEPAPNHANGDGTMP